MFKELRRKDRKMDDDKALELLKAGEYGVLSMIGTNGYGYGVPLNYVYYNDALYFHCAKEGSKLENLKANPNVSLCVIGVSKVAPEKFTTEFESVMAFGRAAEIEGEEKEQAFIALTDRFCHAFMEEGMKQIQQMLPRTAIVKMTIEYLSGKARHL
ncbi:MAG: pyridoxamine 5'-phosphate oxidase family protein [Clostridia bacterium]|nr:pyridoxamine 5'-phosphate oxidase family protein [Clostridia bacterium]